MLRILGTIALLLATVLAGCSDGGSNNQSDDFDVDEIDATSTTGGIRGVVVDQSITPVAEATVRLNSGEEATTQEDGSFRFSDLQPGDYFIEVSKPGFATIQNTASVVAGVRDPAVVKIVVEKLIGQQPSLEVFKFQGFFECHFAAPFIVDNCDMAVRTLADGLNETVGNPGVPRGVQNNINTEILELGQSVQTVIQEGFWENPEVSEMIVLLSSTPVDNLCDCSERDYLETVGPTPTYGRIDGEAVPAGEQVAVRGFLPFGDPQLALNHEYVIITTVFHNYEPAEGWNFMDNGQDGI